MEDGVRGCRGLHVQPLAMVAHRVGQDCATIPNHNLEGWNALDMGQKIIHVAHQIVQVTTVAELL